MKNTLLVFMSLIIVSCSKIDDSIGLIFNQESYETNRELWKNSRVLDYTFSQEYTSNTVGGQPKLITIVIDSELDTIYSQSSEYDDDSIDYLVHYETINDAFDFINNIVESCNEQINSSDSHMEGAKIEVEYHESYYYPTKISCSGYYPNDYVGGLSSNTIISDFKVN